MKRRSDFYAESDVLYDSGFGWVVWDFEWDFSIVSGTIEGFLNQRSVVLIDSILLNPPFQGGFRRLFWV